MMLHCDNVFYSNPELYHNVTFSETKDTIMCKLSFYYLTMIILNCIFYENLTTLLSQCQDLLVLTLG